MPLGQIDSVCCRTEAASVHVCDCGYQEVEVSGRCSSETVQSMLLPDANPVRHDTFQPYTPRAYILEVYACMVYGRLPRIVCSCNNSRRLSVAPALDSSTTTCLHV